MAGPTRTDRSNGARPRARTGSPGARARVPQGARLAPGPARATATAAAPIAPARRPRPVGGDGNGVHVGGNGGHGHGGGGGRGNPGRGGGNGGGGNGGSNGGGGHGRDGGGRARNAPRGRKRSLVWRLRRPIFLIGLTMLAIVCGLGVIVSQTELPEIGELGQASYICARGIEENTCGAGNAMTRLQADNENRTIVPLDEVPEVVVNAIIAMEDRDFFEHDGLNPAGIARALFQNVKGGEVSQGGSTITQQYVKNVFELSTERAWSRKITEAVLSIKLEQQMSKAEILEGYLNTIFFGRDAHGVAAASQAYFGIDVREITEPGQAALLAGVIRAPASAEPTKYPDEAARRRMTALVAMQEEGYLTADEVAAAAYQPVAEPWITPYTGVKLTETLRGGSVGDDYMGTDYLSSYITAELQRVLPERFTDEQIARGGLRIYTSLDYEMQREAWRAVTSTLFNDDDPATEAWEGDPEASMVAVDDQGLVRAMVGSRHEYTPGTYETNYAVRSTGSDGFQPGSTFKPLVLAEALREGYSLRSRFNAQGKMELEGWNNNGEQATVSNYSESDAGVMDMIEATAQSSNTAYAQLMLSLGIDQNSDLDGDGEMAVEGPDKVAELAESMGYGGSEGIAEPRRTPAMALGAVETTPLEMAGVYSTFANRGMYRRPEIITRVEQVNAEGEITLLYQRQVAEKRVLSESTADLVTHALQGVINGGTGEGANIGKPAAGKTGTSQNNVASWFAGYVPRLTAVVWMGYPETGWDDPSTPGFDNLLWPMNENGRPVQGRAATGGSFPATIWKKFMAAVTVDMNDAFMQLSPEQIAVGEAINEGELLTTEEQATTIPSIPDLPDLPGRPGRPGRPGSTTTTADPSTTDPSTTDPTGPTITIMPPTTTPGPGNPNDD
jgi:membrane peptidoglycan carboxypeptidase